MVGKTAQSWWQRLIRRGIVDRLLKRSGEIDVYVIHGDDAEEHGHRHSVRVEGFPSAPIEWHLYQKTAVTIGVCTLLGSGVAWLGLDEANIAMIFLLGVAFTAT